MELETVKAEENAIAINLEKDSFAKFILEFLGTKEKLAYETYASFHLNHNEIEQFYYLLEAKVAKERNLILDHFFVNLIYDDNTRREFSGIENLKQFNETRYVNAVAITLTWNLVTGFPNAKTVENQVIELTFNTKKLEAKKEQALDEGVIKLLITSTNQAWANEILNLFREQINNVIIRKSFVYKCFKTITFVKFQSLMLFLMFIFMGLSMSMGTSENSKRFKLGDQLSYQVGEMLIRRGEPYVDFFNFALYDLSIEQIKEVTEKDKNLKSSLLLQQLIQSKEMQDRKNMLFLSGFILSLLLAITFAIYPNYALKYYGSKSYVLVTRKAEQSRAEEIDSKSKVKFVSFTSFLGALVIGVLVNWISIILI